MNEESMPPQPGPERRRANTAELKADIDAGLTGDKVAAFDPAAAPLGTDEEAAETPPNPDEVALARARELRASLQEFSDLREAAAKLRVSPALVLALVGGVLMLVVVGYFLRLGA